MADYEHEWAMIGTLVNGTYLKNPQKIEIDWVGEYHCLQTIRVPSELPNSDHNGHTVNPLNLRFLRPGIFHQLGICKL